MALPGAAGTRGTLGAEHGLSELDSTTISGSGGGTRTFTAENVPSDYLGFSTKAFRALRTDSLTDSQVMGTAELAGSAGKAVKALIYIADSSTSATRIIQFVSGTNRLALELVDGGDIRVTKYDGAASTTLHTFTAAWAVNTWISVLLRTTVATGDDTVRARVTKGTTRFDSGNLTTAWTDVAMSAVEFGLCTPLAGATNAADIYFDDIIISGSDADISDGYFLTYIAPDRDLTTEWSLVGGGTTHTGNVTDNSNTTGIRAAGTTQKTDNFYFKPINPMRIGFIDSIHLSVIAGDTADLASWSLNYVTQGTSQTIGQGSVGASTTPTLRRSHVVDDLKADGKHISAADFNGQAGLAYLNLFKGSTSATSQTTVWEVWGYLINKRRPRSDGAKS